MLQEVVEQLGFPDPSLTAQDQDPASSGPGVCQQVVEDPALVSPPEESGI